MTGLPAVPRCARGACGAHACMPTRRQRPTNTQRLSCCAYMRAALSPLVHTRMRRLPGAKPFVLAQRYIADPLLINGCKFGVRLWLLVTGVDPLTAYLHNQGLVLFSTDRCEGHARRGARLLGARHACAPQTDVSTPCVMLSTTTTTWLLTLRLPLRAPK